MLENLNLSPKGDQIYHPVKRVSFFFGLTGIMAVSSQKEINANMELHKLRKK